MRAAHVPKSRVYMDKQSRKDVDRRQYQRLVKRLVPSDVLMNQSIDRLDRNYLEIQEQ